MIFNSTSNNAVNNFQSITLESWMLITIFALYLIFSPFYIFTSGYPQPADFMLLIGLVGGSFYFASYARIKIDKVYLIGFVFAFHAFLVNMAHYIYYPDIKFILTSLIYFFNIGAFIFTSFLIHKYPRVILKVLMLAISLIVALQLLQVELRPSLHPFRATGTFNNPNQLAYWVLLVAVMLIVVRYNTKLTLIDYGLLSVLYYLQMLSLSKAGIITLTLVYLVGFGRQFFRSKERGIVVSLLVLGMVGFLFMTQLSNFSLSILSGDALTNAISRILSIGQEADDSLDGRGYTRITENPAYLILGAGEGAFWRYKGGGHDQELHSGLATLLFSYGFVGIFIFLSFAFNILRHRPPFFTVIFIIVMMFGITHQNLRFSLYWIFLALIYAMPIIEQHKDNILKSGK